MLEKGKYEALNRLESLENLHSVVFTVVKLTEGWDVLNLYDIFRIRNYKVLNQRQRTIMKRRFIDIYQ